MDINAILKRFALLKTQRDQNSHIWQQCYDYTYPVLGVGFSGGDVATAANKKSELLDSTSTDAVRTLAAAIVAGMTPANTRWFEMDLGGQESQEENTWLDTAADQLWRNIHAANFDSVGYDFCVDLVVCGWPVMYVDEDRQKGGLMFAKWQPSEVCASSSRPDGVVDTVFREYSLTAAQAVAEFGDGTVSMGVREAALKEPDKLFRFLHVIQPRTATTASKGKLARNLPFASYHIDCDSKIMIRESGYNEFPVILPRWMLIPKSSYGIGPVYDALPDIKMLNKLKSFDLSQADLAIKGLWIAKDDGVLNPRNVRIGGGKILIASDTDSIKPLDVPGNFALADSRIQQVQAAIRKTLMTDQLQPTDGPVITATEAHIRAAMTLKQLGAVYGRLQTEYLQPLIERCFGIAFRAGLFSPPPASLQGREFSVRYVSPLARAQRLDDVGAVERREEGVVQLAQVSPDILDNVDFDEAARFKANALGVPDKILRKPVDVERIRQARAQQQQQQQAAQSVAAMGGMSAATA